MCGMYFTQHNEGLPNNSWTFFSKQASVESKMNPSSEECGDQILVGADMATQEPSPELMFLASQ